MRSVNGRYVRHTKVDVVACHLAFCFVTHNVVPNSNLSGLRFCVFYLHYNVAFK